MVEHATMPKALFVQLPKKDKYFVYCVLSIIDDSQLINPELPLDDVLTSINERLFQLNNLNKRKDDRLRWFYKRFIRFLLIKHTDYKPTKQYRGQDYNQIISEIYFGREGKAPADICNTTYASKKRLLTLFQASKLFAQAAAAFIRNELMGEHLTESSYLYGRIHKIFDANYTPQADLHSLTRRFSNEEYLRLPWRNWEVVETVKLLHSILRLALNIS